MTTRLEWEQWQLEAGSAEAYERYMVPAFGAAWARVLLDLAEPRPGERVLDLGCGTGVVARQATLRVGPHGSVTAADRNAAMLEVARTTSAGLAPAVEWRQANATELPFPDDAFDLVVSQQALQFIDDPAAALREIRRVLAPGGRVTLSVWRPIDFNPGYAIVADALALYAGPEAGAMMRAPFPAWDGQDLRQMLEAAGLSRVRVRIDVGSIRYPSAEQLLLQESASSPLAGPIGALEDHVRGGLVRDLTDALVAHTDDDGVVLPMEAYSVLARA